jgi:hypothetical protein
MNKQEIIDGVAAYFQNKAANKTWIAGKDLPKE